MKEEPPLISGKDLKKNTDYWLTGAHYLGTKCLHNTKVRLARHFTPAGFKEKFAAVVDEAGTEYVIHPHGTVFTVPDMRGVE